MSTGEPVMHTECSDQLEQLLGGLGRGFTDPPGTSVGDDFRRSCNVVPGTVHDLNRDGA